MQEFDITFRFRSKLNISYSFDSVMEHEGIKMETKDGKICGGTTISIEKDDYNFAREKAVEELEKLASVLTLIFGEAFVVEDVEVKRKPIIENKGKFKKIILDEVLGVKDVSIRRDVKYSKESLDKIKEEMKKLTDKINELKEGKDFLRAIKWWRKGNLEEDGVDKFLDYFISFEMLASIKGYKSKYKEDWARKFSDDYSITYKPDGEVTINEIRNIIMHEPGPEKEKAEKLAIQYADIFGKEVLEAIKKIIKQQSTN